MNAGWNAVSMSLAFPGDLGHSRSVAKERRLTPQEKKVRSYQRDGRNAYGEATGASRRGIRTRKASVNRANRHAVAQTLHEVEPDAADVEAFARKPKRWQKSGDVPLARFLGRSNRRRMGHPVPDSPLVDEATRRLRQSGRRPG